MARVHIAEQSGIDGFSKIVALKTVHPHLAKSPELRRMFSTEAKLAARLDHPHIVTVYELGEAGGTYFMSMEYLPGEDLAAILQRTGPRQPIPVGIALWIADAVASALHHAHQLVGPDGRLVGMVHRDVTPSNVMLTYHGVVKLLDFGVAKARTGDASTTKGGGFKGKLAYSAPEQLSGEAVDRRADIFCLGILLWECLTGQRLFKAATDAERIDAVRTRVIDLPSKRRPSLPPGVDALVLKLLARNREERFATAAEAQQAIRALAHSCGDIPTPERAVAWLEELFGSERASIKRSIAQGHNVAQMITALAPSLPTEEVPYADDDDEAQEVDVAPVRPAAAPRKVWSTDSGISRSSLRPRASTSASATDTAPDAWSLGPEVSSPSTPLRSPIPVWSTAPALSPPSLRVSQLSRESFPTQDVHPLAESDLLPDEPSAGRSRAVLLLGGVVAVGLVIAAVTAISSTSTDGVSAPAAVTMGALEVLSEPSGAQVFIDGTPTGLTTPATLRRLPLGRALTIRVERAGLRAIERSTTLTTAEPVSMSFVLIAALGTLRLTGVPRGARVFVDDREVSLTQPLELALGARKVRVESDQGVMWSGTVDVLAGQQSFAIPQR
jgi:serine/threonine-protein kinase